MGTCTECAGDALTVNVSLIRKGKALIPQERKSFVEPRACPEGYLLLGWGEREKPLHPI
jgi:hypothetical protein